MLKKLLFALALLLAPFGAGAQTPLAATLLPSCTAAALAVDSKESGGVAHASGGSGAETHAFNNVAGTFMVVRVVVTLTAAGGGTQPTLAATYNGVSMAAGPSYLNYDNFNDSIYYFSLQSPATGSHNVVVTPTGGSGIIDIIDSAITFKNAKTSSPLGTGASATGNSASASVSVPGTLSSSLVLSAIATGTGVNNATSPTTLDALLNASNNTAADNLATGYQSTGGGSVTAAYGLATDLWGILAVEVFAANSCAPAPPPPVQTGMPAPTLGIWLQTQPTIATIQANAPHYNYVDLVFAGATDGTANLVNFGAYAGLKADVDAWKASTDGKGNKRVAAILIANGPGGGIGNATFVGFGSGDATYVQQAVNSILSLVATYDFNAIDWDLETNECPDGNPAATCISAGELWDKSTINEINRRIRLPVGSGGLGPNFVINQTPRPFELHAGSTKRGWMNNGVFNSSLIQYYFSTESGAFNCGNIQALEGGTDGNSEGMSQFVSGSDGGITVPGNKIIFGNNVDGNSSVAGAQPCTPAQYSQAWSGLYSTYRMGGDQVWQSNTDSGNGYPMGSTFSLVTPFQGL